MNRKDFIHSSFLIGAPIILPFGALNMSAFTGSYLMTVNGAIQPLDAGFVLPHEHILVDFIGADKVTPARYEEEAVFEKALPYLEQVANLGCNTLVECTPAWLGRNVKLMQQLSKASNLHIITNTGYYGAAQERYLPPNAYTESAEELAARWTMEWKVGIDGTGIKPGFIKTGVDSYPLSDVQQKLIKAAALTHLNTGLTIGIHTGDGRAAQEELKIIESMGVNAEAWIWIHAQNESDRNIHLQLAKAGGWVSFDGLNIQSIAPYIEFLKDMKANQLLNKVLLSHDAGWYNVGEPDGGDYRPYDTLFKQLIPNLKQEGFSNEELNLLFKLNPTNAFAIGVKGRRV